MDCKGSQISQILKEIENMEKENMDLKNELSQKMIEANQEIEKLTTDNKKMNEELDLKNSEKSDREKYESIIENSKKQVDVYKNKIEKLSNQNISLESELAEINESLLNFDMDNFNEIVEKAKKNEQNYKYQIDHFKKKIEKLTNQNMNLESDLSQLNDTLHNLDVENINEKIEKANRNEQNYLNQIELYKKKIEKLSNENMSLESEVVKLNESLNSGKHFMCGDVSSTLKSEQYNKEKVFLFLLNFN